MRRQFPRFPGRAHPGDRIVVTYTAEQFVAILRQERKRARAARAESAELRDRLTRISTGTCTTYRCRDCGGTWTWRNTPEGDRALAEMQVTHGDQLVPIGPQRVG